MDALLAGSASTAAHPAGHVDSTEPPPPVPPGQLLQEMGHTSLILRPSHETSGLAQCSTTFGFWMSVTLVSHPIPATSIPQLLPSASAFLHSVVSDPGHAGNAQFLVGSRDTNDPSEHCCISAGQTTGVEHSCFGMPISSVVVKQILPDVVAQHSYSIPVWHLPGQSLHV